MKMAKPEKIPRLRYPAVTHKKGSVKSVMCDSFIYDYTSLPCVFT